MSDDEPNQNPLMIPRESPLAIAQKKLVRFREHLTENNIKAGKPPLRHRDENLPLRDWLPEPDWISGWTAFEIFQLQEEPYEWPTKGFGQNWRKSMDATALVQSANRDGELNR